MSIGHYDYFHLSLPLNIRCIPVKNVNLAASNILFPEL